MSQLIGEVRGTTTTPAPWVRPTDWTALPAIGSQEFQGLFAVTNDEVNYSALYATVAVTTTNLVSNSDSTDASTYTTASVTLKAGLLYLLSVANSHGTSASAVSAITGTATLGSVPTFVSRVTTQYNSSLNRVTILSAVPTEDYIGTLIMNFGGTTQTAAVWSLNRIVGANTTTNHGVVQSNSATGNSTTPLVSLSAFGASTNGTFGAIANSGGSSATPGSGFTELSDYSSSSPTQYLETEWRLGNDTSVDATITSAQWGIAALEIAADAALGDGTTTLQYHVDWGDGSSEDVNSGVQAEHLYTYADSDLVNTECFSRSGNYKSVTFTDAGDLVNLTAHGIANATPVRFSSVTSTTGISVDTTYYVVNAATNTFQVEASVGGGALTLTTDGSGTLLLPAYRQAVVRVTPKTGCVFTSIDLQRKHSATNLQAYDARWLDIGVNSVTTTTLTIGGVTVYLFDLERATILAHSVTNMSNMFNACYSLTSVPLFNTASVTNMQSMFSNCISLTSVPLFNTALVTSMSNMFNACYSLTSVPLFNTASVTSMSSMFQSCYSLTSVPLFNTASVTNMQSMFSNCYSLTSVPLFNTVSVTASMSTMFSGCSSLTSVPLFNTASVTSMSTMFNSCSSLTSVPLFNTASVTNMSSMFQNCSSLTSVPPLVSSGVSTGNFATMFSTCRSLASAPLSGTKFTISYASAKLTRTAIEAIFDGLGIGTSQTITVSTNVGSPTPITKASSGTTAASPTITMADTSSLATGMEITGTGISDALACTFTDTGDLVTIANHGIADGTAVSLATIVTTTGISIETIYYVISSATNTFQLSLTAGGSAIALTNDGSGTLRRPMTISSINPNVSITASANCSANGTVTVTATALQRWKATHKGWTVVP